MKKNMLLIVFLLICFCNAFCIQLGVYVSNQYLNYSNMGMRTAKIEEIMANSLASNFLRTGDLIVSVIYSPMSHINIVDEPNQDTKRKVDRSVYFNREYLGISDVIFKINNFGTVDMNSLGESLRPILDGEMFSVLIYRDGRFVEYTVRYEYH